MTMTEVGPFQGVKKHVKAHPFRVGVGNPAPSGAITKPREKPMIAILILASLLNTANAQTAPASAPLTVLTTAQLVAMTSVQVQDYAGQVAVNTCANVTKARALIYEGLMFQVRTGLRVNLEQDPKTQNCTGIGRYNTTYDPTAQVGERLQFANDVYATDDDLASVAADTDTATRAAEAAAKRAQALGRQFGEYQAQTDAAIAVVRGQIDELKRLVDSNTTDITLLKRKQAELERNVAALGGILQGLSDDLYGVGGTAAAPKTTSLMGRVNDRLLSLERRATELERRADETDSAIKTQKVTGATFGVELVGTGLVSGAINNGDQVLRQSVALGGGIGLDWGYWFGDMVGVEARITGSLLWEGTRGGLTTLHIGPAFRPFTDKVPELTLAPELSGMLHMSGLGLTNTDATSNGFGGGVRGEYRLAEFVSVVGGVSVLCDVPSTFGGSRELRGDPRPAYMLNLGVQFGGARQ